MRKYKIDYDTYRNCFEDFANVKTNLIIGDLDFVKKPFVSYIIPAYGRADLLERTLYSVLAQKDVHCEWDIVVVDNNPEEGNETECLIRRMNNSRILYYRNEENIGVDGNYNRCIEVARGEWVAMIHADDLIMDDHLSEMCNFIWNKQNYVKNKDPVYICQRYIEFSNESEIITEREKLNLAKEGAVCRMKLIYNNGKPELLTQNYALFTGFYAALPSFGTMMKRDIMLKYGGFDKELGICEDIITPYRLAADYGVYMAPVPMGYYRFNNNESMKSETILKIFSCMNDFHEYVYSRNILCSIWGNISRDIHKKNLINYCIGLSRFNEKSLTLEDFEQIDNCINLNIASIKQTIFNWGINAFDTKKGIKKYENIIEDRLSLSDSLIWEYVNDNKHFLVYGCGGVANALIPILMKKYKGIIIEACVVTDTSGKQKSIRKIAIKDVKEYSRRASDVAVFTATEIWEYQKEMNANLHNYGMNNVINLLK